MKTVSTTFLIAVLASSPAFAGAGAPVPKKTEGGPPSGRPGEILDDAKCDTVWKSVAKSSDALTSDEAGPVLVNFKDVDSDGDGKVTQAEFKDGCKKGIVQEQASKPTESGGGQTPSAPEKN